MKRPSQLFAACMIALLAGSTSVPAYAEGTKKEQVFALIVTNNRASGLARPDLRYADDDGAKYYATFRMRGAEENVTLLTDFDKDSQKLFPELIKKASSPSRAAVKAAIAEMAKKVAAANSAGTPTSFYFVFAGHGDVEGGKGFLELTDGHWDADDLQAMLKSVPATREHVILDSCNSFFVINARKPGGTHFATSEDAAKSLSEKLPNVGVFLSTSSEGEVFEWSELQSGIFSHAVRSGLSGAADVNGDGSVSYEELRAFVSIASADVKNPNFRPHVFSRGPGGRANDSIFDIANAGGGKITIDARKARLSIRDQEDIPWVDLHKEAGRPMTLHIPDRLSKHSEVEEATERDGVRVAKRYPLTFDSAQMEPVLLASIAPTTPTLDARGPADMFRMLFAQPFGEESFQRFERDVEADGAQGFGISGDDMERMHLLLSNVAEDDAGRRRLGGASLLLTGAALATGGGYYLAHPVAGGFAPPPTTWQQIIGWGGIGMGGALAISGGVALFTTSAGEDLLAWHDRELAAHPNQADRIFAETETRLFAVADDYRATRTRTRWLGLGILALGLGEFTLMQTSTPHTDTGISLLFLSQAAMGAFAFGSSFIKFPAEQTADLWARDPSLARLHRTADLQIRPMLGSVSGITGTW